VKDIFYVLLLAKVRIGILWEKDAFLVKTDLNFIDRKVEPGAETRHTSYLHQL
jgi:hypothetical protein